MNISPVKIDLLFNPEGLFAPKRARLQATFRSNVDTGTLELSRATVSRNSLFGRGETSKTVTGNRIDPAPELRAAIESAAAAVQQLSPEILALPSNDTVSNEGHTDGTYSLVHGTHGFAGAHRQVGTISDAATAADLLANELIALSAQVSKHGYNGR